MFADGIARFLRVSKIKDVIKWRSDENSLGRHFFDVEMPKNRKIIKKIIKNDKKTLAKEGKIVYNYR